MSKKVSVKTITYALGALTSFMLILGNAYLVKSVDVFGSPLLFAIGLLLELILLVVFAYCLVRALRTPLRIIGSILVSAWSGILTNAYVKRVRKIDTPLAKWLTARLDHKNPFGLLLTCGIVLATFFLIGFSGILQDVWFHEALSRIDTRVVNLMPSIRTPLQTSFFRFLTFTANSETVVLIVLLAGAILRFRRQRVAAALFGLLLIAEEGTAYVLKHLIGRMRPVQSLSLYKEDSFSFPSGHVLRATVLFGLLSYLLYRSFKSSALRLFIVLGYIMSVALVAMSRVYLGVHYPSDVLSSVLIGASLLTLIITGIEIAVRYKLWGQNLNSFSNKLLGVVPIVVVLISLVASPALIHLTMPSEASTFATIATVNETSVKKLPLYSETLTGKTMEPISFIFLGSQQQIERLFLSHGWYKADPSTLANTLKALSVGLQGHQYINAPVTPSYLAAQPENLAFQQPTQANTLRQRHHTRLWRTAFKVADGRQVWVATASFDEGVGFAGPAKLPTHHIDPNIDAEQSYIIKSLGLRNVQYLQVVNPQAGKNAGGDTFFTAGKAVLTQL